jgi:hypothetical protein
MSPLVGSEFYVCHSLTGKNAKQLTIYDDHPTSLICALEPEKVR